MRAASNGSKYAGTVVDLAVRLLFATAAAASAEKSNDIIVLPYIFKVYEMYD